MLSEIALSGSGERGASPKGRYDQRLDLDAGLLKANVVPHERQTSRLTFGLFRIAAAEALTPYSRVTSAK